jgi:hypothetical protein
MHTNVAISSDKNTVNDTCLTYLADSDRSRSCRRSGARAVSFAAMAMLVPAAGWLAGDRPRHHRAVFAMRQHATDSRVP